MDSQKPTAHKRDTIQYDDIRPTNRQQSVQPTSQKKKHIFNTDTLKSRPTIVIITVLIAVIPIYYFYNQNKQAQARLNDPNTGNRQVIDEVVKKASKHILLPSGEQPTLATVSDISKVKGQPFFQNAQNGDKVIVFTQARKAYLYRPSSDIIIEVAPLNIDSTPSAGTSK